MGYSTVAVKMLDLHSNKFKPTLPINRTIASEFSDRIINLNKFEERNLEVRIKQISKENDIKMHMLKREIDRLKHDYETNQDRIDLIRKQRQMEYEENLRRLLNNKKASTKDMDIMHIHNTSKNLAAFYNLSNKREQNSPQQQQQQQQQVQPLIKREPSRISVRNKLLINPKSRLIHSSYAKSTTPVKLDPRLANTATSMKHPLMLAKVSSKSKNSFTSDVRSKLKSRATSLDLNSIASAFDDNESLYSSIIDQDVLTLPDISDATTDSKTVKANEKDEFKQAVDNMFGSSSLISRKSTSAPPNSKRRIEIPEKAFMTDDKARQNTREL